MENEIQVLQHLLNESRFTLVSTGAGISVSAGIPSMHGLNLAETMQFIANVNHFFTLLGKMFFTPYGKEFFTYLGKQIFTS